MAWLLLCIYVVGDPVNEASPLNAGLPHLCEARLLSSQAWRSVDAT
jgi:hypothetical protein